MEETVENEILYESLTRTKDDEPGNSFVSNLIKAELKEYHKKSEEFKMLKNVETLMSDRLRINREIREKEIELKELVENRILILTKEEIDKLVYEKWFGSLIKEMTDLIERPLKNELDTLKLLDNRYKFTLEDLDEEYKELEAEFESLVAKLVKQ